MQRYTVHLYLETALHVSGGTSSHHQERIKLYLQHLLFVTPLLLSAAIVEELEPVWVCCGWRTPPTAHSNRYVWAPDDGWIYHPKHIEQFPDINKLCNFASCWICIGMLLGARPILRISRIMFNSFNSVVHGVYSSRSTTTHWAWDAEILLCNWYSVTFLGECWLVSDSPTFAIKVNERVHLYFYSIFGLSRFILV
jgi:hypothetical protein